MKMHVEKVRKFLPFIPEMHPVKRHTRISRAD